MKKSLVHRSYSCKSWSSTSCSSLPFTAAMKKEKDIFIVFGMGQKHWELSMYKVLYFHELDMDKQVISTGQQMIHTGRQLIGKAS